MDEDNKKLELLAPAGLSRQSSRELLKIYKI